MYRKEHLIVILERYINLIKKSGIYCMAMVIMY